MIVEKCPAYYNNLGCMSNKMFFKECSKDDSCIIKQIIFRLKQIIISQQCDSCDGCGYDNGCIDETCGTYQAYEIIKLLGKSEGEGEDKQCINQLKK